MEIIERAVNQGRTALSEYESKLVLKQYGIPVTREILVNDRTGLPDAAKDIGYPLVLKASSPGIAHKTEEGLIHTDLRNETDAVEAYEEIISKLGAYEDAAVLVQEMIRGKRELVAGMTRDPQFGPCVMFGLGGIFTEILHDVSFRVAPIDEAEATEMTHEIRGAKILDQVRGMPQANMESLAKILVAVGNIGLENEKIKEIDINPLILSGPEPVAVDALIILEPH